MINSAAAKEILAEAERLEIKNKAPVVLCELLFTHENPKGQKYLIGGIEKTVESFEATLLPKVGHIFKELFEEDILEEEVIFEWAKKVSKKNVSKELAQKIHDKAAPFIKWLQEAEEETSESDGDVEIEYDERAKISKLKEAETSEPVANDVNENQKKEESDEDEAIDDDDIDNI